MAASRLQPACPQLHESSMVSLASSQYWLQYFLPSATSQVQAGCAHCFFRGIRTSRNSGGGTCTRCSVESSHTIRSRRWSSERPAKTRRRRCRPQLRSPYPRAARQAGAGRSPEQCRRRHHGRNRDPLNSCGAEPEPRPRSGSPRRGRSAGVSDARDRLRCSGAGAR